MFENNLEGMPRGAPKKDIENKYKRKQVEKAISAQQTSWQSVP